jgi:hypothetical protein
MKPTNTIIMAAPHHSPLNPRKQQEKTRKGRN